ncbi:MAG: glycoside hydrolase [Alphaproteobacteria bacterium]|nr:glycoside hydrolase [Alphaproteobacteria bacterium]
MPSNFDNLELPIGEGSRIPLGNMQWMSYLTTELSSMDSNFDLKLPLWSLEKKGKVYSWILLSPFSNNISFTKTDNNLNMQAEHEFNKFNQPQKFEVLLHIGATPLSGAIRYRKYLQDTKQFTSLRDKVKTVIQGTKLIGATHLYLWGNTLLSTEDIKDWPRFLAFLQTSGGKSIWQHLDLETQKTIQKLHDHVPETWQKASLIEAIDNALQALVPVNSSPDHPDFLAAQHQQAVKLNQLAQRLLGHFLSPAKNWGTGLSEPVIKTLHDAGLARLWLGTDNWTSVFLHPHAVKIAKDNGYLIASYDSYDTGIPRGLNDSWLTAQMPSKLIEKCAIIQADGSKKTGFGGQGYYLNPACVLSFSQNRMRSLVDFGGLNSLFLDVDGTGMVSDDYNEKHPLSSENMAAARNKRLTWFSDSIKLPLGSEDGNAVTAQHLMFAHGMESWGFGWRDKDMRHNKESPYYLGAWWPSSQPATFFATAKVKPLYRTVAFDPRYRLPLYQAVFHDSVITTHHWTLDNLKFSEVKQTRNLLSQLYNTPPLFNLSRSTLKARLPEIIKVAEPFRILHQVLWDKALTGFRWLDHDGWLQETTFSDGSKLTVNFGDTATNGISPHSLRARLRDGRVLNFSE